MNKLYILFLAFLPFTSFSQNAFHNFGNVQIHDQGQIGFHIDLINDGTFNQNLGFAGFYNFNGFRTVSGSNRAVFYNLEVDVLDDLELFTSLGIKNNLEYITGRVITPRNDVQISLDFINYDIYAGEGDTEHTDGYVSITGEDEFIFPIGDDTRLRPMIIPNQSSNNYFNGAFFYENPNTPSTFSNVFDTTNKQLFIENISNYEFWDLDGDKETIVTLTWDSESNIPSYAASEDVLRVVGWSKIDNKWIDLGRTDVTGDINSEGTVTSNSFIPNDYEILTIGTEYINIGGNNNFAISPNDDNINDALVFEGLDQFQKNELVIYNRWGALVYQANNYQNNWEGVSSNESTIYKNEKVPDGVYFYVLTITDTNPKEKTGWIYVRN